MKQAKHNRTWYFVLAGACVLLVALAFFLYKSGLGTGLWNVDALQDFIQSYSPYSELIFFLLQLCSVIIAPIPSNVTALAGGMVFGVWRSFLISVLAITLGSVITFSIARVLGQKRMERFLAKTEHRKYLDLIESKRDVLLVLIFLLPFFPDDLICILAGLTDIPFKRFLLIVLLTRHWGIFVAVVLGNSAGDLPIWALVLVGAAMVALSVLVLKYGDKFKEFVLGKLKKK